MNKKKIVIIGANEFQNPLILKAKEMGFETHVFAWECGDIGEKTADYFYPISITEKEEILAKCREIHPTAVTSIGSDLAVVTVNYLAENLGLPSNGIETTKYTTNKYEMRCQLEKHGIPVPRFKKVSDISEIETAALRYPLIVKPTDRSGSRGVTKVFDAEELKEAIEYGVKYSFEHAVIIEDFLEGNEYSCESISYKGRHKLLTVTKKYTTGAPHYIETGHIEPADLSGETYEKIDNIINGALDALNITTGASHAEIKINENGEIGIIEIGARMGGDCIGSDLVYLSTGYDFLKMTIQAACGIEPDMERKHEPSFSGIRFLFSEEDIKLMKEIEKQDPKFITRSCVEAKKDMITDSSTRWGYFIMQSETPEKISAILMQNSLENI